MGNPKGNPGNKGGGRKSAYEERRAAQIVKAIFSNQYKLSRKVLGAIKRKDPTGLTGWDMVAFKVRTGNDKVLVALINKLVPDKIDSEGWQAAMAKIVKVPPAYATDSRGYTTSNTPAST